MAESLEDALPPLTRDHVDALDRYADAMDLLRLIEVGSATPTQHVLDVRALSRRVARYVETRESRFTPDDVERLTAIGESLLPTTSPPPQRSRGRLPNAQWNRALSNTVLDLRDRLRAHVAR